MQRTTSQEEDNEEVSDEEILNILRRSKDERLSSSEVADELPITQRRTVDRLKKLQDAKRPGVIQRKVGQGFMWRLADSELDTPVQPKFEGIARWSSRARTTGNDISMVGNKFLKIGIGIVFVALTALFYQDLTIPFVEKVTVLAFGYATLAGGGGSRVLGELLRLLGISIPRIVNWTNITGSSKSADKID